MNPEGTDIRPFDRTVCWTVKDWVEWMQRSHNPTDHELAPWRAETTLVVDGVRLGVNPNPPDGPLGGAGDECTRMDDGWRVSCSDPGNRIKFNVDWPRAETRTVTGVCPSPSPTPGPTPTPGPGGCPTVTQVGGSFLTARDCGPKCVEQGYLGYVVNVTSTELCQNGTPGCSCDPARNRCETPKTCQSVGGSTVYLSLPGHFSHDLADERSDNAWNHQHKPKANETGVTEFLHCPLHAPWSDARCTPKCMDIQSGGPREVACN